MKQLLYILCAIVLSAVGCNNAYSQDEWVIRLRNGQEVTCDIDSIQEMFVRKKTPVDVYCNMPAKFVMENVYQAPVLYIACNSSGEFCSITTNGKQFIFKGSKETSYVNMTALTGYTSFYLGLSGLIVGLPNIPGYGQTESMVVCYDLACPNCYEDYNITKPLTLHEGGTATCKSCGRTYDLNNGGIVSDGNPGKSLFRYRVNYLNYTLIINNKDNGNHNNNDYSSYPPSWKGFQFTCNGLTVNPKTGIHAGDVITVTALQDEKGHLINACTYNWSAKATIQKEDGTYKADSLFFTRTLQTNYDYYGGVDPSVEIKIPTNASGRATLSFNADFNYSGNGIQVSDGGTYESSTSISGSIHSYSGAISGGSKGSVTFIINER